MVHAKEGERLARERGQKEEVGCEWLKGRLVTAGGEATKLGEVVAAVGIVRRGEAREEVSGEVSKDGKASKITSAFREPSGSR